jgi:hypothetical protein
MKKQHLTFPRISRISVALVFLFAVIAQLIPIDSASAAQITTRSLTLIANGTDGGSKPGGVVNHAFNFTVPSGTSVGSIEFKYCTLAAGTCTMPTGVVTTGASLNSQTGATGFTMVNSTNGAPYLTRGAATITGGTGLSYQLNTITNPTSVNGETFYVRISTFSSTNATTGVTDTGTVAAATARGIDLSGTMPESLVFCAGAIVSTTLGVPDCSTVTTGAVAFNQLFSPTDTATASSQMAASTNAGAGYAITVN